MWVYISPLLVSESYFDDSNRPTYLEHVFKKTYEKSGQKNIGQILSWFLASSLKNIF